MKGARKHYVQELTDRTGISEDYCRGFVHDMRCFISVIAHHFRVPPMRVAVSLLQKTRRTAKLDNLDALGLTEHDEEEIAACVEPRQVVLLPKSEDVTAEDLAEIFRD
jgi:hypothetical protein